MWEHKSTLLELFGERLDVVANAFSLPCVIKEGAFAGIL